MIAPLRKRDIKEADVMANAMADGDGDEDDGIRQVLDPVLDLPMH